MPLTDKAIKSAKPTDKAYKLADSEGMFLMVYPTGNLSWYLKYRISGKEKRLHLGSYPDVSLQEARDRRHAARVKIRNGEDPGAKSKHGNAIASSWGEIADEWLAKYRSTWSDTHIRRVEKAIQHMRPTIGAKKPDEVTAVDLLNELRKLESAGKFETALKTKQAVGQIFRYAIATSRALRDPSADLRGALAPKPRTQHHPHLDAVTLPQFVRSLRGYRGSDVTRLATHLLLLTFVRTTDLRHALPHEIDVPNSLWRIPGERMKNGLPHIVPLSKQALEVLEELEKATASLVRREGAPRWLFPQPRKTDTPISENAILSVIDAINYKGIVTGHGFRGTASTILNENGWPVDAIERQLAHVEGNKVRAAYNHAEYLPQRREMMQWWADYIDRAANSSSSS